MRNHCNSGIHQHRISYASILNADQYTSYCTTSNHYGYTSTIRRTYKCLIKRYAEDTGISVVLPISSFCGPNQHCQPKVVKEWNITLGTPRRLLFPTRPFSFSTTAIGVCRNKNSLPVTPQQQKNKSEGATHCILASTLPCNTVRSVRPCG